MKLKFSRLILSPYAIVIPSVSFHHSLLDSFSLRFIFFSLNPTLTSEIRKETCSCNMRCHAIVLPEDQKYPPLHQRQDNWNALPSTRQWMFLLHLHSTWTVNLTSSHNNGKHFQQLSELIYSDPYRANFEKEKRINLQLRIA